MKPNSVRHELQDLQRRLIEIGLAVDATAAVVTKIGDTSLVTWAGSGGSGVSFWYESRGALNAYRRLLRDRQYSFLLADGALLQICYTFERDELVKHRLVYHPCPLRLPSLIDSEESPPLLELFDDCLLSELAGTHHFDDSTDEPVQTIGDAESDAEIGEFEWSTSGGIARGIIRLHSPLRFDFDRGSAATDHPASHLTICGDSVRWAVFGPLSVGHFLRFVTRHFYPKFWSANSWLKSWPIQMSARSISPEEETELYIEHRVAR